MEWYVHESINRQALNRLFADLKADGLEIHTLQMYRGDQQLLRLALEPYTCRDPREIYSLSKLFTSCVVGIAVDRGLVREDDRIVDILGITDGAPGFENLRLRHVLSMNTGHDRCVMDQMREAEDSVAAFFSVEPKYEPGTHFVYNSGASCLLTAVVERVTGMRFFDFACEILFYPLGITDVSWKQCRDGRSFGGAGLYASSDDIMRLGRMIAAGGVFEGRRILSREWLARASSAVSDNSSGGTPDWRSGYGYQIWRNSRDGFRGDGAFGQYCLVLPRYGVVMAVQAMCMDMQRELDHIFTFLDHMTEPGEPAEALAFPVPQGDGALPELAATYRLEPNSMGFSSLRLTSCAEGLSLTFSDGCAMQTVKAVPGRWTRNPVRIANLQPGLRAHLANEGKEPLVLAAACCARGGELAAAVRYCTSPHQETWYLRADSRELTLRIAEPEGYHLRGEAEECLRGRAIG